VRFLFLTIILITYGTLYPLEFLSPSDFSIQIGKLINFRFWNSGIADAVANILLFIPFGIALYHAFKPRSLNSILGLAFITFLFAYLIQFCQIWTLVRIPYGGDAIWNLCGSIIGMILFVIFGKHWSNINGSKDWNRNLPFIIIACFVVIDLQPFIPTFDIDTIKNNLKAMTSTVDLSLIEIVRHALFYMIPIKLWQQAAPYTSSLLKVGGGLAILVFLQLFIVNSDININMLSGAFIAFIAVGFTVRIYSAKTLLSLIITLIVLNALNAMEYRASVPFNWIPFKPALSGNTLVNIFALIEKSLFYFLFFYISSREKVSFRKNCVKLSLIIFTLEVLQTNIQGATPDITENIVVLLIGYITWKWLDIFEVKGTHSEDRDISLRRAVLLLKDARIRLFLMYATVAIVAQMLFMSLPQLPYNIVELYNDGGTFIAFTSLFLAVFVAVGGMVWIAQGHSAKNISDFRLPLYCAYLSMATFLLLKLAVTRESIADINGSSNITYQLTGPRILGDFGHQMVMFFGEQSVRNISQIVEPFIRFATLTGPVLYLLTLFLSFSFAVNISKDLKLSRRFLDLFKSLCFILPWFYLCKLISFDFSSTDNLNELIARDGSWGIGGGGYLYGLLIIIALTVTYNVHAINKKRTTSTVLALITFVLSFPVTWILFKSALVGTFEKYGHTFSGVDFILGGSRTKLLPEPELMMRWGLVYLVIIVSLSMSIILALRLVRHENVPGESQSIIPNNPQPPRAPKKLPLKFNFNI
jgi:glycopeptide antibiotics resistance protein